MVDLINPDRFEALLRSKIQENNEILKALGARPLSFAKVHAAYRAAGDQLRPFVVNTVVMLHEAAARGENILFEGAQGTFLDIDHGTYPFVTSSNTTAGGACTGSGVPPNKMDRVVGVMKAYITRVGEGPLPTESAEVSDLLHGMGREFGATTGRPRRCGWFDAVATHHSTILNGLDDLAVTCLDGLDTLDTIKVCLAYRAGQMKVDYVPTDIEMLAKCEPVYAEFPGWKTSTTRCAKWRDLPVKARNYLRALSELTGARLKIVSVGPEREQTIFI
jgi:adenylosuccinate synthase